MVNFMNVFFKRVVMGFAIGLTMGSAFAAAPASRKPASAEDIFYETETFIVRTEKVPMVRGAMAKLELSEDVDFAWLNKVANGRASNFVCYSIECHRWAKQALHTYKKAPNRPEEALGKKLWKDPELEAKKNEVAPTEEEQVENLKKLRYSRMKAG